jgi:site-specific DNA recombinase
VVVVYKVDRLTRSLADFAKLVELFDQHQVSFVSVTQSFNTTTSMGRLTLNVLLSFAQFEREVTAERIRDKIAASKRKGMRMGGPIPLGYDVENKRLVVNPEETERVRLIFRQYLELGCLTKLSRDLNNRRIHTKVTRRGDGSFRGGIPFTKGPLAHLLKNRVYIGEVIHKGQHYPGEHEPILESALFEAVQQKLASRAHTRGHCRINEGSLLTGRIFDDRGNRMTPSTAKKGAARYRYYVSAALLQGRREDAGSVARVPAADIEAAVTAALKSAVENRGTPGNLPESNLSTEGEVIDLLLDNVVLRKDEIELVLRGDDKPAASIIVPWSTGPPTCRREIILPSGSPPQGARAIRSESRARLVEGIAKARLWLGELIDGRVKDTKEIAEREGCSDRSIRMTLSLAFLNPKIVQAAVKGALPQGSGIVSLLELPADWQKQIRLMP